MIRYHPNILIPCTLAMVHALSNFVSHKHSSRFLSYIILGSAAVTLDVVEYSGGLCAMSLMVGYYQRHTLVKDQRTSEEKRRNRSYYRLLL